MGITDDVPIGRVAGCRRYPLKSAQGLEVPALEVDPKGIDGDRTHGIVDVSTGRLLAAKRVAALLMATADDQQVTLPDGTAVAYDDPAADRALSDWLGRKVRLVTAADAGAVAYEMTFDPPNEDAEVFEIPVPEGTLVDIAPVHAITTASLAACQAARPDLDWDVRRFRPNLVLDLDVEPFEEQGWIGRDLTVGGAILRVTGPMVRCAMPLRPQPGLERAPEIFRALSDINTAFPNHLGLCLDVVEPGRIEVGEPVSLG
ncbi:MAG: MOSC domain-containing protein [Acidimicrobiales bacterium]